MEQEDIDYFKGLPYLHSEAVRVSVNVNRLHYQRELGDYTKALSYATPEMEAFEILLDKVDCLMQSIKNCDIILKALHETKH
jgi:hypothetical protein